MLTVETIIGSNYSPLILSSGEEWRKPSSRFFFGKSWFEQPEFGDKVEFKLRDLKRQGGHFLDPVNAWQFISTGL
jgi:hypothetical protein